MDKITKNVLLEGTKKRITEMQELLEKDISREEKYRELQNHLYILLINCMPTLYMCLCKEERSIKEYLVFCERGIKNHFYERNMIPDSEWKSEILFNDHAKED